MDLQIRLRSPDQPLISQIRVGNRDASLMCHRGYFLLTPTYHQYGQALTTFKLRARNGWDGAAGGARKHHDGQSTAYDSLVA